MEGGVTQYRADQKLKTETDRADGQLNMSLLKSFETQSVVEKQRSRFERFPHLKKKISLFILMIFLVGMVVEVWAANRLSTYGEQIAKITQETQQLTLENQLLGNEIAEKASFNQVEQHAKILGFEEIQHVQYLQPLDLAFGR